MPFIKGHKINVKRFCVRGHDTFKIGRNSNHSCLECLKNYSICYYWTNKKVLNKLVVGWQRKNRKHYNDYIKKWRKENKAKFLAYQRAYYKEYRKNNPWLQDYHREYMKVWRKK
jgi:hypothetical protein